MKFFSIYLCVCQKAGMVMSVVLFRALQTFGVPCKGKLRIHENHDPESVTPGHATQYLLFFWLDRTQGAESHG
jgi:hypothetical protein